MRRVNAFAFARYLARRPGAIPDVVRSGWRLRTTAWWRHFPFLPLPDKHYWDFRVTTVLGSTGVMRASDMVEAARWANRQRAGR